MTTHLPETLDRPDHPADPLGCGCPHEVDWESLFTPEEVLAMRRADDLALAEAVASGETFGDTWDGDDVADLDWAWALEIADGDGPSDLGPGIDGTADELGAASAERLAPCAPAASATGPAGALSGAAQLACLHAVVELLADIDGTTTGTTDGQRIDLIAACETLKGAIAAAQARVSVAFADSVAAAARESGRSARTAQRGIAPQVALARRCTPTTATTQLGIARALTSTLTRTMGLLTRGVIGPGHAAAVHAATSCLSQEDTEAVDERLADELPLLTPAQARGAADRVAGELDPDAVLARHANAVRERSASSRPAPDGMAYLTILGALPDIVGAHASLRRHANAVVAGGCADEPADGRTFSNVLSDTALNRIRGIAATAAQPVAVTLVMTPENLFGKSLNDILPLTTASSDSGGPDNLPDTGDAAHPDSTTHPDNPADIRQAEDTDTTPDAEPEHDPRANPQGSVRPDQATPRPNPEPAAPTGPRPGPGDAPCPEPQETMGSGTTATGHRPGHGTRCAETTTPARIVGHTTSIPTALARQWLLTGCDTPDPATGEHPALVTLRRVFTSPDNRDLIALETPARLFPPLLRSLLILRDDRCRMPHCDSPIRHADHITPHADGGPTSYLNGQGLSARCNYTKDLPGFTTHVLTPDQVTTYAAGPDGDRNTTIARTAGPDTHVTAVTTPTGHTYLSIPPPVHGWGTKVKRRRTTRPATPHTKPDPLTYPQPDSPRHPKSGSDR
ncbi:MAG: DUF222 domain-containing protein [Dermatophilaceae bacterium]